jgi:hypothetical protein
LIDLSASEGGDRQVREDCMHDELNSSPFSFMLDDPCYVCLLQLSASSLAKCSKCYTRSVCEKYAPCQHAWGCEQCCLNNKKIAIGSVCPITSCSEIIKAIIKL